MGDPFTRTPLRDVTDRQVTVPWIQMRGRWLKAAGFAIGTKIKVRVQHGRLVLTAEEG